MTKDPLGAPQTSLGDEERRRRLREVREVADRMTLMENQARELGRLAGSLASELQGAREKLERAVTKEDG